MIERFRVRGYKALADVELALTPLHVVIGPNDSGKTSLQEALAALCRSTRLPLDRLFPLPWSPAEVVTDGNAAGGLEWEVEGRDAVGSLRYFLEVGFPIQGEKALCMLETLQDDRDGDPINLDGGRGLFESTTLQNEDVWRHRTQLDPDRKADLRLRSRLVSWLSPPQLCRWVPSTLALPNAPDAARRFRLDPDGFGLTLMLDDLLGESRQAFAALEADFRGFFPNVTGLKLKSAPAWARPREGEAAGLTQKDGKALSFTLESGRDLPAAQASDGLLLVLAYLTLLHLPEPPGLLLVEEPENGIHPKRLPDVIRVLRELTERGGTQVLATTHSPHVLDCFEPEEVTICARRADGTVATRKLSEAEKVQKERGVFTLGEIWAAGDDAEMAGVVDPAEPADAAGLPGA